MNRGHGYGENAFFGDSFHGARVGEEGNGLSAANAVEQRERGEATSAIAAHIYASAVGIVIEHGCIAIWLLRWIEQNEPVGTDAEMTIAESRHLF